MEPQSSAVVPAVVSLAQYFPVHDLSTLAVGVPTLQLMLPSAENFEINNL